MICTSLIDANFKLATKLSNRALHPGDNKQSVSFISSLNFSSHHISRNSRLPENEDAASFLQLIDTWWIVVNSKEEINSNNRLGNAAIAEISDEFCRLVLMIP